MSKELEPRLLTDEERRKFFRYCEAQSEDRMDMAKQMSKIGINNQMLQRERNISVAYKLVAQDLDPSKWESVEVKG